MALQLLLPLTKIVEKASTCFLVHQAPFVHDPRVTVDMAVSLKEAPRLYPVMVELKRSSSQEQEALKLGLQDAHRAIKSAGEDWKRLRGFCFPYIVMVCGDNVHIIGCTVGEELLRGKLLPTIFHTTLCRTKVSKVFCMCACLLYCLVDAFEIRGCATVCLFVVESPPPHL